MNRADRPLTLAWILAAGSLLGAGSRAADAQYVVAPGGPTVIITPTAPVETFRGRPARRAKKARRYSTMRPAYPNRPGISFAPYSDRYLNDGRFNSPITIGPPVPYPVAPR